MYEILWDVVTGTWYPIAAVVCLIGLAGYVYMVITKSSVVTQGDAIRWILMLVSSFVPILNISLILALIVCCIVAFIGWLIEEGNHKVLFRTRKGK